MLGLTASGNAETAELNMAASALSQQSGPVFVPGEAAQFAAAFADMEAPEAVEQQAGAVDISAIEPAVEEATRDLGVGIASYYGRGFAGRPTASGERFNPAEFTAAHRTLPFGTRVRVTNPNNGKSVVVRINDRGPFVRSRMIDLSQGAAEQIGLIAAGHGTVRLEIVSS